MSKPAPIEYGVEDLPDESIGRISALAGALATAYLRQAQQELDLEETNNLIKRIEEQELPGAMGALGMAKFTLTSGETIEVKEEISASLAKTREAEAFRWLRQHKQDAIIKRLVALSLGKGDDKLASEVIKLLKKMAPDSELIDKPSIHASTLKAFVRERIELEKPDPESGVVAVPEKDRLPRDLFGVFIINRARIKAPK